VYVACAVCVVNKVKVSQKNASRQRALLLASDWRGRWEDCNVRIVRVARAVRYVGFVTAPLAVNDAFQETISPESTSTSTLSSEIIAVSV